MTSTQSELELGRQRAARIEGASRGRDLSSLHVAVVWFQQLAYTRAHKIHAALTKIGCGSVRLDQGGPCHLPPMGVYVCVHDRSHTPPGACLLLEILKEADILDSNEFERYPYGKPGTVYILVGKKS